MPDGPVVAAGAWRPGGGRPVPNSPMVTAHAGGGRGQPRRVCFVEPRRRSRCGRARARPATGHAAGSGGAGRRCRRSRRRDPRRRPARLRGAARRPAARSRSCRARRPRARRSSMPPRCRCPSAPPSPAPASCRLPTTIGDLFRWMPLSGSRRTPSGRSALRVNRRSRRVSTSRSRSSLGSCGQVPGQQFVLVGRMTGQRPHHGQAAPLGREHARHVEEGLSRLARRRQAEFGRHPVLAVQAEREVEQPGLLVADQPGQRDGGAHVRQRIVRRLVQQAVGARQVLELEARACRPPSVGQSMPSGRSA